MLETRDIEELKHLAEKLTFLEDRLISCYEEVFVIRTRLYRFVEQKVKETQLC